MRTNDPTAGATSSAPTLTLGPAGRHLRPVPRTSPELPAGPTMRLITCLAIGLTMGVTGCSDTQPPGVSARVIPGDSGQAAAKTQDAHEAVDATRITLGAAAFATADIAVEPVAATASRTEDVGLEVPGQVELDPRRVALVSSRIAGRIERLAAVEGDRVSAGEPVAYLYSPEFLTAQADLAQAERRVQVLEGTLDETGARALANAARRRLRLMGASDAEIQRAAADGEPATTLSLRAPFDGSIMEAHILTGGAVEPGAPIFTVADLSVIDVIAEVPERSLPLVRTGQRARVRIAAFPSLQFDGSVERLRAALNAETRTVRAVIHVPNGSRRLRPGMFATVELAVAAEDALGGGSAAARTDVPAGRPVLTIPETAVVTDGERRFVFVEVGLRTYERREVRLTSLSAPGSSAPRALLMAVQDGLRAGERVVVRGAFTLKSELAKASLADDEH